MDKIVITGGAKLKGAIDISGSKNAALPVLIATLLTDDDCVIENVPDLADIHTTVNLLEYLGKKVVFADNRVTVNHGKKLRHDAPYELVRKMRASVLVMGPLLARLGKVDVSLPGGCAIGARPIDIHLSAFERLGASIAVKAGFVEMKADKLKGAQITLRFASVGATENILLAAVLAEGRTVIKNAACEPEIADLADILTKMGSKIAGAGTETITIDGVETLHGVEHTVIPDRIEAATYLIGAAITKGDVVLNKVEPEHLKAVTQKLEAAGMDMRSEGSQMRAKWVKVLSPINVKTDVYPGFPTDVQAQWMALMATVPGNAKIEELVFENRLLHAVELQRLGASIAIDGNKVTTSGVNKLSGRRSWPPICAQAPALFWPV